MSSTESNSILDIKSDLTDGKQLRVFNTPENIWFVGKDLVKILEYKDLSNTMTNIQEKYKIKLRDLIKLVPGISIRDDLTYQTMLINEPGLYSLIFHSTNKKAGLFQDWIRSEIIPSIRKREEQPTIRENSEIVNFTLFLPDNTPISIPVNTTTGYINVTKICKAVGKEYKHWRETKDADDIISMVERSLLILGDLLIINITTGLDENRGTFVHRLLAISIACWAHPYFSYQVAAWSDSVQNIQLKNIEKEAQLISVQNEEKEISTSSSSSTSEIVDFTLFLPNNTTISIPVNTKTGYINVTNMCKAAGKEYYKWRETKDADDMISALERSAQIRRDLLIINIITGLNENRGTFTHRLLAIHIACWAHPYFSCQVAAWSDELFLTGKVTLGQETQIIKNLDDALITTNEISNFQLTLPTGSNMVIPIKNGRVNATILCKAGGKTYSNWIKNKGSEETLLALEKFLQLPRDKIITTITNGPNDQRGTFVNRKLGIILAMWVNPDFFVQIARWIDELLITGSVTLGKEKSLEELNKIYLEKLSHCHQELEEIKNQHELDLIEKEEEIIDKEKTILSQRKDYKEIHKKYQKLTYNHQSFLRRKTLYKLREGKCIYLINMTGIIDDALRIKIGFSGNITDRVKGYRTSSPFCKALFVMYSDESQLLESTMKKKYEKQLVPNNREFITDISLQELIKSIKDLAFIMNIEYTIESQEELDEFNNHIIPKDFSDDEEDEEDDDGPVTKRCGGKTHSNERDRYMTLDKFSKNASNTDGYARICKECYLVGVYGEDRKRKKVVPIPEHDTTTQKWCNLCEKIKEYSMFYVCKGTKDGFTANCKECKKIQERSKRSKTEYR